MTEQEMIAQVIDLYESAKAHHIHTGMQINGKGEPFVLFNGTPITSVSAMSAYINGFLSGQDNAPTAKD